MGSSDRGVMMLGNVDYVLWSVVTQHTVFW